MNNKNFLELKIPPPVVFSIFAGLLWLVSRAMPSAHFTIPGYKAVAAGIAAVGGLFAAPAIWSFLRAKTTVHPENPSKTTKLVVSGVYASTRNPMYLSLLLVLIAWAVYLSNFASFAPLPFFVAYVTRFQIMPEERALRALFGSEFEAYCKRVRRWL
jgi:protein-S-isoprenylcysteine O-methyltransferase Ste14